MKMKSKLFGFGAKSALYLMAICGALFTSCYEKEEIDADPIAPAAYYVIGSVSNGSNGQSLNATVTVDGAAVTLTNGAFIKKVDYKEAGYVVAATADGFYPVTRTVYCIAVAEGQTSTAVADIRLFDATSQVTPPTGVQTPTEAQIQVVKDAVVGSFIPKVGNDATVGSSTITINDDGSMTIATPITLKAASVDPVTVTYSYYEGFDLATDITTRAVTFQQQFLANASAYLNRVHPLAKKTATATLKGGGLSITGYILTYTINLEDLVFNIDGTNYGAIVSYMTNVKVAPTLDSHDSLESHDSHDSHDGHGGSSNAGGGAGTAE